MAYIGDLANTVPITQRTDSSVQAPFSHPNLRVLFITDRLDAPFRYRCMHPCLQLRAENIPADIALLDFVTPADIQRYSVVILFRLPWCEQAEIVLRAARANSVSVLFDIDDLIFDPTLITTLPFWETVSVSDKARYIDLATRLSKTFEEADGFIGATDTLAAVAAKKGKHSIVSPNVLHPSIVKIAPLLRRLRRISATRPMISYMSGSATHDLDFLRVASSIKRVLADHRDAVFLIGGYLDFRGHFAHDESQILRLPFVDWFVLPWIQSLAWVNIAPLASLDQFSHSKSALKFFEAGILGVPTVASPGAALKATIRSGENGFLCSTSNEWYENISACLDWEMSRKIGESACQTVYDEHSFASQRTKLRDALGPFVREDWCPEPNSKRASRAKNKFDQVLHEHFPGRSRQTFSRLRSIIGVLSKSQNLERLRRTFPQLPPLRAEQWFVIDPSIPDLTENCPDICFLPTPDSRSICDRASGWEVPWDLVESTDEPGAWISTGKDPCLLGPEKEFRSNDFRFLILDAKVLADSDQSLAQLYWLKASSPAYREEESVVFPVICDGKRHLYLVDLRRTKFSNGERSAWAMAEKILRLRFDPIQCEGELRIYRLALAGEALLSDPRLWNSVGRHSLLDELVHVYLVGEGAYIGKDKLLERLPNTAEILWHTDNPRLLKTKSLDFSVVELRGQLDTANRIKEVSRAVRPGGIILAIAIDFRVEDPGTISTQVEFVEEFSSFAGALKVQVMIFRVTQ